MADVVRAALVQQKWTGDKDSMVKNAVAAVAVRDLDMGLLEEVRQLWQFYRDRRPETCGPLTQP